MNEIILLTILVVTILVVLIVACVLVLYAGELRIKDYFYRRQIKSRLKKIAEGRL